MTDPRALLGRVKRIAVVGCSATPGKPANYVPEAAIEAGYDVVPVNPTVPEILGRKAYATLADVPGPIDMVQVFRPAAEAPAIAREAVALGAKALWLQTGIASEEARRIATAAGLDYVEDRCVSVELARMRASRAA